MITMLTNEEKKLCLQIARDAIAEKLKIINSPPECPDLNIFTQKYGLFVTLTNKGRLRGCIGYIVPRKTLYQSIVEMALSAAFKDNRFKPVTKEEFDDLEIEISILSPLVEVIDRNDIKVGRDGLFLQHPEGSGLLLPQVATKYNWDSERFLIETCYKAGLSKSALFDPRLVIYRFEVEIL